MTMENILRYYQWFTPISDTTENVEITDDMMYMYPRFKGVKTEIYNRKMSLSAIFTSISGIVKMVNGTKYKDFHQ